MVGSRGMHVLGYRIQDLGGSFGCSRDRGGGGWLGMVWDEQG